MINRELIRIKIVQLTYAYYQNGNRNMDNAEKELLFSLSKAYDLYNFLLELIVAVTREERHRYDVMNQRAEREGAEPPSNKFVNNQFATQLEENNMLNEFIEVKKLTWKNDIEFVRKLCNQIEQSHPDIDTLLEEKSLYWNDDKEVIDTFVLKTIKRFDPARGCKQELLPEYKDEEDKEFARKLFRATILNADTYQHYMSDASRNWDFARLAYMDVVIMQIAIAEMLTFPGIPAQVTINEFVELAKLYSTPRSSSYVNGMLDSIARYLISTGKMMKEMPEPRNRQQDRQANGDGASTGRVRFVHRPKTNEEPKAPEAAGTDSATTDPADANEAHNANGAAQD